MKVVIKSPWEIEKMRVVGQLAADVLAMVEPYVLPGVTTDELDRRCHEHIVDNQGARSACLGYRGFPKSVCISVNEVVCHGIPGSKLLKEGDIVNIDVTVVHDGYHGDTSKMFFVGQPTVLGKRLCNVTQKSLYLAIEQVGPGVPLVQLGRTIQQFVESHNFSVVREYCGHGIGANFHEDPQVLHYESRGCGTILQPGMTFTIEPMVNAGKAAVRLMPDGWTVKTKDRSLSAQYEHTILVTESGCEILTWRPEESLSRIVPHLAEKSRP